MKAFLDIRITWARNGVKVKVGCHEFVYTQEDLESFSDDLLLYLTDPEAAKKEIFKRWEIKDEDSPMEQPVRPIRPTTRGNRIVDAGQDETKQPHPRPTRERSERSR